VIRRVGECLLSAREKRLDDVDRSGFSFAPLLKTE